MTEKTEQSPTMQSIGTLIEKRSTTEYWEHPTAAPQTTLRVEADYQAQLVDDDGRTVLDDEGNRITGTLTVVEIAAKSVTAPDGTEYTKADGPVKGYEYDV